MVQSMTGFAQGGMVTGLGKLQWELRALNSRYLDLQLKLPEVLRQYEGQLRTLLTTQLQRGKVEVVISLESVQHGAAAWELNTPLVSHLLSLEQPLSVLAQRPMQWQAADLFQWPAVLRPVAGTFEVAPFMEAFTKSVEHLIVQRAQEGQRLQVVLGRVLDSLEQCVREILHQVPAWNQALKQKVHDRWKTWALEGVPGEAVWTTLLLKSDIQEECDRLLGHVTAARTQLKGGGLVGKMLDFLSQEMNREANTLGVKVAALDGVEASMQLKVGIDQIREQAQNLV